MDCQTLEVDTVTWFTKMKQDYEKKLDWARESIKREIRKGVEMTTAKAKKWADEAKPLNTK